MSLLPSRVMASVVRRPLSDKNDTNFESGEGKGLGTHNIQVSAIGEVSLSPDRCRINIALTSTKEVVEDVKNSVTRRLDYIKQTLSNHLVKEADYQVYKDLKRVDSVFKLDAEVNVQFSDFQKCQTVSNLLVEKLDNSVTVSLPHFYHSVQSLEGLRKQASLLAIHNAKQKAQDMARFVHQTIGHPITIREEECRDWDGSCDMPYDPEKLKTRQELIVRATITASCKIYATFELKQKQKNKMKR